MEKSIFQLASEYNFDAVFDYHNNGNSINICDEDGNSLFATFLSGYACYGDIVEDEEELLMFERLVKQMADAEGITEKLKVSNQMEWVRRMNNIRNRAVEITNSELIYA